MGFYRGYIGITEKKVETNNWIPIIVRPLILRVPKKGP